jgi:hypothetical protein
MCRVKDTCIIVAVEDMPDDGLDQPLRLDKLANEVLLLQPSFKPLTNQLIRKGRWYLPVHLVGKSPICATGDIQASA